MEIIENLLHHSIFDSVYHSKGEMYGKSENKRNADIR